MGWVSGTFIATSAITLTSLFTAAATGGLTLPADITAATVAAAGESVKLTAGDLLTSGFDMVVQSLSHNLGMMSAALA